MSGYWCPNYWFETYPFTITSTPGQTVWVTTLHADPTVTGWVCPLCGRVFSPTVTECESCNENKTTIYETRLEVK